MKKLLLVLCLLFPLNLSAAEYSGTITKVVDGDTVWLKTDTQDLKIRMRWIDAPESKQAYGKESTDYLSELIFAKRVDASCGSKDRYKRSVCTISKDGVNINKKMVESGHAWSYKGYSTIAVAKLQIEAQSNNIGMWESLDPTCQPWNYRKKLCK